MGKSRQVLRKEYARAKASLWRVVTVRPAAEGRVEEAFIERHGLHAFVPREVVWRTMNGRRTEYRRPLFRGFVLVQLPDDKVHLVHTIDGASSVLRLGGVVVRVDTRFMDKLFRCNALGVFDQVKRTKAKSRLSVNDLAEVLEGPFAGFFGWVIWAGADRRVRLLLEVFGRMTPVELDDLEVAKAKPPKAA